MMCMFYHDEMKAKILLKNLKNKCSKALFVLNYLQLRRYDEVGRGLLLVGQVVLRAGRPDQVHHLEDSVHVRFQVFWPPGCVDVLKWYKEVWIWNVYTATHQAMQGKGFFSYSGGLSIDYHICSRRVGDVKLILIKFTSVQNKQRKYKGIWPNPRGTCSDLSPQPLAWETRFYNINNNNIFNTNQ